MTERERITERLRLLAEVRDTWLRSTATEFRTWLRHEMKAASDWPANGRTDT